MLNFSLDFLHIKNKTSQTLHPYLICISHFLLKFDRRQRQRPCQFVGGSAQWVCRRSRKNSDVQIGRKGGNGIKFNGQVTAKRFWKKKSRKWHSWVRRSLQRFGQVCLNWSELSSRRRQIFSRIFMDAIFFYFIQSVSLSVTAGVTTCKDDISFFLGNSIKYFSLLDKYLAIFKVVHRWWCDDKRMMD